MTFPAPTDQYHARETVSDDRFYGVRDAVVVSPYGGKFFFPTLDEAKAWLVTVLKEGGPAL